MRGINAIDVKSCRRGRIEAAIKKGLSPKFKKSLKGMPNPYKGSGANRSIVEKLKKIPLNNLVVKRLFECQTCKQGRP